MTNDKDVRDFWRDRWTQGRIGFHEGRVNVRLARHAEALLGDVGGRRVLVPLSGKSIDMKWLAERGHDVIGCELVDMAARAFFEEASVTPTSTRSEPFESLSARIGAGTVTVLVGDVLDLERRHVGEVGAVFDRAALIALDPIVRKRYVAKLFDLLPPGARMLLVSFEHDAPGGPPYAVEEEEVRSLFEGTTLRLLEREDVLAESAHIVERGATRVFEATYLISFA